MTETITPTTHSDGSSRNVWVRNFLLMDDTGNWTEFEEARLGITHDDTPVEVEHFPSRVAILMDQAGASGNPSVLVDTPDADDLAALTNAITVLTKVRDELARLNVDSEAS